MIKEKFDILLFDLDGTLTNSGEGIARGVDIALRSIGIEEKDFGKHLRFIGPPIAESFNRFYGLEGEVLENAVTAFRAYYNKTGLFVNFPYEGIEDVLKELKENGKVLCLATSKPEDLALRVLERFDLVKYFDIICGSDFSVNRDSKTLVVEEVLKTLNVLDKSKVLMIGDRLHDIEGAKNNGIKCLGVLYGFGSQEEFEEYQADYIIENVKDLLQLI